MMQRDKKTSSSNTNSRQLQEPGALADKLTEHEDYRTGLASDSRDHTLVEQWSTAYETNTLLNSGTTDGKRNVYAYEMK